MCYYLGWVNESVNVCLSSLDWLFPWFHAMNNIYVFVLSNQLCIYWTNINKISWWSAHSCFITHISLVSASLMDMYWAPWPYLQEKEQVFQCWNLKETQKKRPKVSVRLDCGILMENVIVQVIVLALHNCWWECVKGLKLREKLLQGRVKGLQ